MKGIKINLKKRWMNYLNKLAKVNSELYGSEKLDCCGLDKRVKKPR